MPRIRHDVLTKVREIENVFIPMPDGCRLAARLFLPIGAETQPAPAILEYIPYRKRDFMRERDEPIHRYFAGHGYAAVRVDVRGSGDSEGTLGDEYSKEELDDAVEIIKWISIQGWCDGNIGMMGISWGGFNALQVAALSPPHLKAIITLCSSDDRYADDAHYMGGCLLNENLQWGAILMTYNALPPDPEIVGDRWRSMWLERLDHATAFPVEWMEHPWRDAYWKRGSVCEDYSAIQVPVYAIGGWADGYSNAVGRLLAGLTCAKKGLVGPWAHTFPHNGIPGPSIGFLQEALRWWNHWLRGQDTGIMDEPVYRVWMQESLRPAPQHSIRPGRWVAEQQWPSRRIHQRRWFLDRRRLNHLAPDPGHTVSFASPQATGMAGGEWCAFGADGEMPLDQRTDDGQSLSYDSTPLDAPLEILGAPVVDVELSADTHIAMIAVRLNDVAADGTSTRVTYGLMNLTHRESHEAPTPLVPGERYRVRIQMNDIAHSFPKGHRIRLALSSAYWPIAWPPPSAARLTLHEGPSSITLPDRPRDPMDDVLVKFEEPEVAPGTKHKPMRPLPMKRFVERDLTTTEVRYTLSGDGGEFGGHATAHLEDINLQLGYALTKRHRIIPANPLTAISEISQRVEMRRTDWSIQIESIVRLSAAPEHLDFSAELQAMEGERVVRTRQWKVKIPRRLF